ncbi:MAG: formylglycine-generating enzyme family protein [Myxococcota bacterium]
MSAAAVPSGAVPPATAAASASSAAPSASGAASAASNDSSDKCPDGMVFIEGDHCSLVEQKCLEYALDKEGKEVDSVCLRFEKPSKCNSTGRWHLRYCMDRYEYPNELGEKPLVLVDFRQATELCEAQGKRLCTPAEFNFACEGEDMWPYATGFEREPSKCNIDKEWRKRTRDLLPYEECMKNKPCAEQFARLDQRHAIGERKTCVSPFGVYDLNGNVNEWVFVPWGERPFRGAIKGGWWGPVRNRCRPIVTSHDEKYTGYEVGFRCCKDAAGAPPVAPKASH